jgi:hypothetical protein
MIWLGRAVLAFLGLAAGFLIAEALIRTTLDIYACDERVGWTFEPDKRAWKLSQAREISHAITMNSHGFHDRERQLEKPEGTFRILLLGDSMTASTHVPAEQGFPTLLERRLNDVARPGWAIEVVNAGVDGYGQVQELLLFREMGRRFDPDLVLAGIFLGNDVADNSPLAGTWNHYLSRRCGRPYVEPDNGGPASKIRLIRPETHGLDGLLRISELYNHFAPLSPREDVPGRFDQWDVFRRVRRPEVLDAWESTKHLLVELHDEAGRYDVPIVFVVNPEKQAVGQPEGIEGYRPLPDADYAGLHDMLNAFLDGRGFAYIDLRPPLQREVELGTPPYYRINSHWNATGNAVVSDALYRWLAEHCRSFGLPLSDCR